MSPLRDLPPLRSVPFRVDARLYNHARLALLRIGCPLELELESMDVDLVLERRYWVGYHSRQIALPLLAWEGFETARDALDAPVACTMHLYHHHAWLQHARVLLEMDRRLEILLAAK